MKKDPIIFLEHIYESIEIIKDYTKNKSIDDFRNSIQLQDSIIRRLEIIGEAIKNISLEFTKKYEKIPWRELAGLRDVLIHQYFGIDLDLTWEVIKTFMVVLNNFLGLLNTTEIWFLKLYFLILEGHYLIIIHLMPKYGLIY